MLLALAAGVGLMNVLDRPGPRSYWQMALGAALMLMPVVGLQAWASRLPFVALSRGSAGPLLVLTVASVAILGGLWVFAIYHAGQTPEDAALLFLPAALLVPAMLGAPGSIGEGSALGTLGLSCLVAGVAVFLCLLGPPGWRPIGGGVALGVQFALLWAMGRGPVIGPGAGTIVPVSAVVLLGTTVLLTVLAPLGALFSRRFFQTVEEETGSVRAASVPLRGARRSDYDR